MKLNFSEIKHRKRLFFFLVLACLLITVAARAFMLSKDVFSFCNILGFSHRNAMILWSFETVMLVFMWAVAAFASYRLFFSEISPEKLFAFLVFCFGLIFLFIITPLSVPDERTHFNAIYELSCKLLSKQSSSSYSDFAGFANHQNVCTGILRVLSDFGGKDAVGKPLDIDVMSSMWTITYFAEYIPQIFGVSIAMLLGRNMVTAFILGRFCNLLFYTLCVYLAIKRTPRFKIMFGLAALMPMALQQAASLSYDNFINALCLLLLASIIKALTEEAALNLKDILYICIPALLLAPAKGVYALAILLILLIPRERFSTLRIGKGTVFALLLVGCVAVFAVFSVPSILRIMSSERPGFEFSGDSLYSVGYIFAKPFDAFQIFADTFNVYILQWLGGAVGISLSTYSLDLPIWIPAVYALLLILSAQNIGADRIDLPHGARRLLLLLSAFIILSFMMTMFLTWIRNTDRIISGVQGRYFIPIIPMLLICTNSKLVQLNRDPRRVLVFTSILLLSRTVLEIISQTMFSAI